MARRNDIEAELSVDLDEAERWIAARETEASSALATLRAIPLAV
ncbi:hypothetical protein [Sphingomonas sp. LR55]